MNFKHAARLIAIHKNHVANCEARLAHAEAHDAPAAHLEMFRANLARAVESHRAFQNIKLSDLA